MNDQTKEVRMKNWALEDELAKLQTKYSKLSNDHDSLSNEHNSLSLTSANETGALRSRMAELETEKERLSGWERRSQALSIELEEQKRRAAAGGGQMGADVDTALSKELHRGSSTFPLCGC